MKVRKNWKNTVSKSPPKRPDLAAIIPAAVKRSSHLTAIQKLLLGRINLFRRRGTRIYESNREIGEGLSINAETVRRNLKLLEGNDWIQRDYNPKKNRRRITINEDRLEDDQGWINIHMDLITDTNLSHTEIIVLSRIVGLARNDGGYCYAKTNTIATDLGSSINNLDQYVKKLDRKGFLVITKTRGRRILIPTETTRELAPPPTEIQFPLTIPFIRESYTNTTKRKIRNIGKPKPNNKNNTSCSWREEATKNAQKIGANSAGDSYWYALHRDHPGEMKKAVQTTVNQLDSVQNPIPYTITVFQNNRKNSHDNLPSYLKLTFYLEKEFNLKPDKTLKKRCRILLGELSTAQVKELVKTFRNRIQSTSYSIRKSKTKFFMGLSKKALRNELNKQPNQKKVGLDPKEKYRIESAFERLDAVPDATTRKTFRDDTKNANMALNWLRDVKKEQIQNPNALFMHYYKKMEKNC